MNFIFFFMFLGTTPLLMLPGILAWFSQRPGRGLVLGVNFGYLVVAIVLAVSGVVGVALALATWLALLAWSLHPPKPVEPGAPKFEITD